LRGNGIRTVTLATSTTSKNPQAPKHSNLVSLGSENSKPDTSIASKPLPPNSKVVSYQEATQNLQDALEKYPGLGVKRALIQYYLTACQRESSSLDLSLMETLLRQWRQYNLLLTGSDITCIIKLCSGVVPDVPGASPIVALKFLSDPVGLGVSPSSDDLRLLLRHILSLVSQGQKSIKGDSNQELGMDSVALAVVGLRNCYFLHLKPCAKSVALVLEICLQVGTPKALESVQVILNEISQHPELQTLASELVRLRMQLNDIEGLSAPNSSPSDQLESVRNIVQIEKTNADAGNRNLNSALFPVQLSEAVRIFNAVRNQAENSKEPEFKNAMKKLFGDSSAHQGLAHHLNSSSTA
jgi:hypothetical protein